MCLPLHSLAWSDTRGCLRASCLKTMALQRPLHSCVVTPAALNTVLLHTLTS